MRNLIFLVTLPLFASQNTYDILDPQGVPFGADSKAGRGFERWAQTEEFTHRFEDLPLSGRLKRIPWSGSNWPEFRGGISWRWYNPTNFDQNNYEYFFGKEQIPLGHDGNWESIRRHLTKELVKEMSLEELKNLSPSEKFDVFTGTYGEDSLHEYLTFHFDWESINDVWAGYCGGWSAVALHFPQPQPVTLTSKEGIKVPFGSSDIKALLIYYIEGGAYLNSFMGYPGIWDEIPFDPQSLESNKLSVRVGNDCGTMEEHCGDMDFSPSHFHSLVTNLVGLKSKGLIIDVNSDYRQYFQPLWSYSSKVTKRDGKLITITTEVQTSVDLKENFSSDPGNYGDPNQFDFTLPSYEVVPEKEFKVQKLTYSYVIELNEQGEINYGSPHQKWLSARKPDSALMWQKPSEFQGFMRDLNQIYKASITK